MFQDPSHRHEPSPPPRSDLADVVSAVTASQDNRPLMQDSTDPHESLSHANSELVEVVSKEAESEAVRLLASRIPPELFEDILFYVNVDRDSQESLNYLERKSGTPSPYDALTDLKQCSLVCLFWANKCREHIFRDRTLAMKSYEDAKIFRRYVIGGCQRLTPVHQLIREIYIIQDYQTGTSFLYLLCLSVIRDKLDCLFINGPIPGGFNPAKLDTPHWSIPTSILVPGKSLPNRVYIYNLHLPSFYHVIKYFRHFSCAAYMYFDAITWDGPTPPLLPRASSAVARRCRPCSVRIRVRGICTNSIHLSVTALMLNPNCPLHRLSDEERMWMIRFLTLVLDQEKEPDVLIEFDVSEKATTMDLPPFNFVFEEAPASADRSASALSMVGIAYICDSDELPVNFDALVNHARTHPTIGVALLLLFDSFDNLQERLKLFVEALDPATEAIELVFAYEEEAEKSKAEQDRRRKKTGRVLGADPATLEPSGRIWADLPDKWRSKGSEILRRELKKRR